MPLSYILPQIINRKIIVQLDKNEVEAETEKVEVCSNCLHNREDTGIHYYEEIC